MAEKEQDKVEAEERGRTLRQMAAAAGKSFIHHGTKKAKRRLESEPPTGERNTGTEGAGV